MRIVLEIAKCVKHIVAGIIRDAQCLWMRNLHEAGPATTMGSVGTLSRMGAGDEQCIRTQDPVPVISCQQGTVAAGDGAFALGLDGQLELPPLNVFRAIRVGTLDIDAHSSRCGGPGPAVYPQPAA